MRCTQFFLTFTLFSSLASATLHHIFVTQISSNNGDPNSTLNNPTIYSVTFDDVSNKLSLIGNLSVPATPVWAGLSHDKKTLFSTNKGGWASFSVSRDPKTSHPILSPPSLIPSIGPCQNGSSNHFVTSRTGRVYAIFYGGGPNNTVSPEPANCGEVIAPLPLNKAGPFGSIQSYTYGEAFNSSVHGVALSADEKWLYSADMKGDALYTHSVNPRTGTVSFVSKSDVVPAGAHPRHVAVHPSGNYVYVVNEGENILGVWYSHGDFAGAPVLEDEWDLLNGFGHQVLNRTQYWSSEVAVTSNWVFVTTRSKEVDVAGYISVFKVSKEGGEILSLEKRQETTWKGSEVSLQIKVPDWGGKDTYILNPRVIGDGGIEVLKWDGRKNELVSVADLRIGDRGCCAAVEWLD